MSVDTETAREAALAAYGRVMAKIGAFEQFLRVALARREVEQCAASGKPLDTAAFSRRLLRMEFGGLAQQVCSKFAVDPAVRDAVKQAKEFRNYLAHNFWAGYFHNLRTARGLESVRRHCVIYDEQFERVAALVIRATGVDMAHYVAFVEGSSDEPEIMQKWESLLEEAEASMRETGELFKGLR